MAKKREKTELKGDEIQLVSFILGDETFAIEVSQVHEIVRLEKVTTVPRMADFIEGVVNLRGQITTVIDMRKRFSMQSEDRTARSRIIIGEVGSFQFGMIVDAVSEVIRVSPDDIAPPPEIVTNNIDSSYLKGICKLPGNLVMLLDLNSILSEEEIAQIDRNIDAGDKPASIKQKEE